VGGLQWYDINGNGKHAQTDDEKATALLDFFQLFIRLIMIMILIVQILGLTT